MARRFITSSQEDTDMADVFPGSWSGSVVSSDGREVWFSVLISGYSWSGVDYDLIGPLATRDELESARLAKGFLNPDEVLPADLALMRAPRVG